jgi:hypothetical protein
MTIPSLPDSPRSRAKEKAFFITPSPAQICARVAQDPDNLLDMLMEQCGLKYDGALARMLGVAPSIISKIRGRRLPIGPALLLRILEITDTNLSGLQRQLAYRRSSEPK